jgi:hypothetical protein
MFLNIVSLLVLVALVVLFGWLTYRTVAGSGCGSSL